MSRAKTPATVMADEVLVSVSVRLWRRVDGVSDGQGDGAAGLFDESDDLDVAHVEDAGAVDGQDCVADVEALAAVGGTALHDLADRGPAIARRRDDDEAEALAAVAEEGERVWGGLDRWVDCELAAAVEGVGHVLGQRCVVPVRKLKSIILLVAFGIVILLFSML